MTAATVAAPAVEARADAGTTEPAAEPGAVAAPSPPPAPATPPPTWGPVSPRCVNGWFTPARNHPLRKAALDMMRQQDGDRFVIAEMRYFVGPEDAEVISPRGRVERWYVKGHVLSDPSRRYRWLIRRAKVGRGIDAVAPYDSTGYGPGTWKRADTTDEKFADPFEHPCDGAAPEEKCMGLPREVLGCLDGT